MNDLLFTVFTATYNRAYILPRLFESLCSQTQKSFEWLIIDDGSTDETEKLVESWKCRNDIGFPINYHKKANNGKPRAINDGVNFAKGRYFVMVDSDDYLIENAIEKMALWVSEIDQRSDFIGVGAAKGYSTTSYIKGTAPKVNANEFIDCTNLERSKYDLDADMIEAYKTYLFAKFPMAEWPGEKFAPEQIALNDAALAGYKIRWHKDIIEICNYLPDGLTMGSFSLEKSNPMGYAMMYNHTLKYPIGPLRKYKNACQHIALSIVGKNPEYILKSYDPLITILSLPLGLILSIRRAFQFRGSAK